MIISVPSGKGGTGKTTVSVNLALAVGNIQYVDCDVEDPDGEAFLHPEISNVAPINVYVPKLIPHKCNYCGKCSDYCSYNAIIVLLDQWLLTPQLCKNCGGCYLTCPNGAIIPESRKIGSLYIGTVENKIKYFAGELNTGEAMATPIIKRVKKEIIKNSDAIIDCPPGTSCSMINSIEDTDFCLFVTEPTSFGLHDLKTAVEVANTLKIKSGVVINKSGLNDSKIIRDFCSQKNIPILLEIPYDKDIAVAYSTGIPIIKIANKWQDIFSDLFERIKKICKG